MLTIPYFYNGFNFWNNRTNTKKCVFHFLQQDDMYEDCDSVSLPLQRYSMLVQAADMIRNSVGVDYHFHLGAYYFVETLSTSDKIHFTKYEEIYEDLYGLCVDEEIALNLDQFNIMVGKMCEIDALIPELSSTIPCYLREDHQNQQGAMMCPECNPSKQFY